MKVREFGDDPDIAVVAGVHGDEPCGPRAVDALLSDPPEFRRPVKFVVANERALARERRYLDDDLNRSFPGDADAESHERRLAHALLAELEGCTTLALHSTQSHPEPFALVDELDAATAELCAHLPLDAVVETARYADGRLIAHPDTVEVECGQQWSDTAATNARRLVSAFLAATDVVPEDPRPAVDAPVFRLTGRITKPKPRAPDHQVFVDNFERVPAGRPFAAGGGDERVASEAFYPVLLSADGYESVYGYASDRVGTLTDASETAGRHSSAGANSTSVRSRSSMQ
jgi:succinylglutamate desuccinylase